MTPPSAQERHRSDRQGYGVTRPGDSGADRAQATRGDWGRANAAVAANNDTDDKHGDIRPPSLQPPATDGNSRPPQNKQVLLMWQI